MHNYISRSDIGLQRLIDRLNITFGEFDIKIYNDKTRSQNIPPPVETKDQKTSGQNKASRLLDK